MAGISSSRPMFIGRKRFCTGRWARCGCGPLQGRAWASRGPETTGPSSRRTDGGSPLPPRGSSGRSRWKGGPAIDLGPAEWAGGSWGRNGWIVYTLAYNTGLSIVSEGGGDARVLTTADTAKGELGHWWPQVLPDAAAG